MTAVARRRTAKTVKIRPVPDAKIRPAESLRCPDGHEFGLDRQRFYAVHGLRPRVKCPLCGTPTALPPKAAK